MKKTTAFFASTLLFLPVLIGAQTNVEFAVLDIYVDSQSQALAAWQFELLDRNGHMQVVGVENGEHAAFDHAPAYDRDAIDQNQAERIVVASFSLNQKSQLPTGSTRVATIHVRLHGNPDYQLRLVNAGNHLGDAIPAEISLNKK